jgi:hypothetical protein
MGDVLRQLGMVRNEANFFDHPLMQGDSDAVPVLLVLAAEQDADLRLTVCECLEHTRHKDSIRIVRAALVRLCMDDNERVRHAAEEALFRHAEQDVSD